MKTNSVLNLKSSHPSFYKWSAFAVVSLATVMQAMDFTLINLSFPTLSKTFDSQLATLVWLNLMFSLVVISFGMFFGKLSDIVGRKRFFLIGAGLMIIGLIACAISLNVEQLIIFRIIYAIGSAMITTTFAAIITDVFPPSERGKGMGLQNSSLFLGFTIAPFLTGVLLNWLGWRSIFYIRIPIAAAIFLMALIFLKKDKPAADSKLKFDFVGTLTSSAGFLSMIIGVNLISRLGTGSPVVYALIIAGFVLIALFVYVENRAENPIVDLSLFKNIPYSMGMITIFLYWCAWQGSVVTSPFFLTVTLGWSVPFMGILFTISSVTMIIVSSICGPLSDRIGPIPLIIAGIALSVVTLFVVWTYTPQTNIAIIFIMQLIGGSATGMFQPANNSLVMGAVQADKRGMASAMTAAFSHFGLALGMAWAGMYYSLRIAAHKEILTGQGVEASLAANQSVYPAFHDVIIVATFIQILTLVFSLIPKIKEKFGE